MPTGAWRSPLKQVLRWVYPYYVAPAHMLHAFQRRCGSMPRASPVRPATPICIQLVPLNFLEGRGVLTDAHLAAGYCLVKQLSPLPRATAGRALRKYLHPAACGPPLQTGCTRASRIAHLPNYSAVCLWYSGVLPVRQSLAHNRWLHQARGASAYRHRSNCCLSTPTLLALKVCPHQAHRRLCRTHTPTRHTSLPACLPSTGVQTLGSHSPCRAARWLSSWSALVGTGSDAQGDHAATLPQATTTYAGTCSTCVCWQDTAASTQRLCQLCNTQLLGSTRTRCAAAGEGASAHQGPWAPADKHSASA